MWGPQKHLMLQSEQWNFEVRTTQLLFEKTNLRARVPYKLYPQNSIKQLNRSFKFWIFVTFPIWVLSDCSNSKVKISTFNFFLIINLEWREIFESDVLLDVLNSKRLNFGGVFSLGCWSLKFFSWFLLLSFVFSWSNQMVRIMKSCSCAFDFIMKNCFFCSVLWLGLYTFSLIIVGYSG